MFVVIKQKLITLNCLQGMVSNGANIDQNSSLRSSLIADQYGEYRDF